MTILNRSKLRPDVLKQMEAYAKIQEQVISDFFHDEENKKIDFQALWKKVEVGNKQFFKGKDMRGYMTEDEQRFLAKYHRYTTEEAANFIQKKFPISGDIEINKIDANGVNSEWQIIPNTSKDRVLIFFHGGGYIMGSPNDHRLLSIELGRATNMRVLSVDYRLAPEYPHPAPLEDSIAVYKWLLSIGIKPENIIIAGDSAGGNLALTTLIKIRNDKLPIPKGAFCLSPNTDYALTGESFFNNAETDPYLADLGIYWWALAHIGSADPRDPLVSPLYADLKGLPPLLLQASTIELLFDDSTRFNQRAKEAGVDVKLETWKDMMHVFQAFNLPEAKEAIVNIREFVKKLF